MVRKRLVAGLLILIAGSALLAWLWPLDERRGAGGPQAGAAPATAGQPPDADPRFASVPQRAAIGEPRADPFTPREWGAETPAAAAPQPAAPPSPPPMPYRYAGKVLQNGIEQVLLAKGDMVIPVRVGATLEGGYRVESIDPDWIELQYLPLRTRQRVPVASMLDLDGRR